MKRYLIIYEGTVQGVGFRYYIYRLANKYHLTGYAKNLSNLNVEVVVQGDFIDDFLKDSLKENSFIKITNYTIKEIKPLLNENNFTIKY